MTIFSPGYLGVSTGPAEDTAVEDTAEEDTAVAAGASIAAVAE